MNRGPLVAILAIFWLAVAPVQSAELEWHDLRELTVEGMGWSDTATPWERLPARAEGKVDGSVHRLSQNSAGINVRFVTDAPAMSVRWTLRNSSTYMHHMTPLVHSGFDLYARDGERWRWLGFASPAGAPDNEKELVSDIPAERREYRLYLPAYNGVLKAELGVPAGSVVEAAPARPAERAKPIVFYGTSITQGGCASRSGMLYSSILSRRLDRPALNLGFSGNGRMQEPVVELLCELDAAVFVLDNLPNMQADEITERAKPTVLALRAAHPGTPIILAEDRDYSAAWLKAGSAARNHSSRAALRAAYEELVAEGVKGLYYIEGPPQLGDEDGVTVDGSHLTDLGMVRLSDSFEPVIRQALRDSGQVE